MQSSILTAQKSMMHLTGHLTLFGQPLGYIDPVFNVSYGQVHTCGPIYRHAVFSHDRAAVFCDGACDDIFLRRHIFHMYDDDSPMVSLIGFPAQASVVQGSLLQFQVLLRSQVLISIYNCFQPIGS